MTQGRPSDKRRVVRNTLSVGVAQAVQVVSAFIFMPLLIGGFGILNYGVYLLVSSLAGYAGVLDLGLGPSLARLMAECRAKGDTQRLRTAANTALAYYIAVGVIVAAALAGVAFLGVGMFDLSADEARIARNLLLIGAVAALLAWPLNAASLLLAGAQRHDQIARVSVGVTAAGVLGTAAVLALGQGPVMLMGVTSAVGLAGGAVSWAMAHREYGPGVLSLGSASIAGARDLFAESWAISIVQLCSMLLYQQTDRVVLGVFLGAGSVGLYEAAAKFQNLVIQLVGLSSTAVMPAASQLHAQGRNSELQGLLVRGTKYTGAFLAPVIVGLILLAKPLLLEWLGPSFADQALVAQVLLAHWMLTAITAVGAGIVVGTGSVKRRLPNLVLLTVANVALSLVLVQRLGIIGVALGTTITFIADFPFNLRFILRTADVPLRRFLAEVVLPVYPLLLVPAAASVAAMYAGLTGTLIGVVASLAVGVAAYWTCVYAFAFSAQERAEVAALVRQIAAKAGYPQARA